MNCVFGLFVSVVLFLILGKLSDISRSLDSIENLFRKKNRL